MLGVVFGAAGPAHSPPTFDGLCHAAVHPTGSGGCVERGAIGIVRLDSRGGPDRPPKSFVTLGGAWNKCRGRWWVRLKMFVDRRVNLVVNWVRRDAGACWNQVSSRSGLIWPRVLRIFVSLVSVQASSVSNGDPPSVEEFR